MVKEKAVKKNIDFAKCLTFVEDITRFYTEGGLRCTIIANAANWRLKPGGGGVNAAIFNAAGLDLEIATKEIAGSLSPGKTLVVPLPSTSALYRKEGDAYEPERIKKSRGLKNATGNEDGMFDATEKKPEKTWGSWSLALYNIAMNPERHKNILIEILDDVVVLNDLYPKAEKHLLVLARKDGLGRLADVRETHLPLLKTMHDVGEKWAKKFLSEDPSLIFRLGYHSVSTFKNIGFMLFGRTVFSLNQAAGSEEELGNQLNLCF
ncbi:hypothetical protein GIB67_021751 [Kingdonia uniflora]|uniref:Uncharacterized protein n=1 Tax=Kingdonia uniflora TaxID=39325 RepID=A0A7J7M9K9_9MAGN|nr:hypothetical protein GIB67_021751 [Kingdonia uniflora]